MKTDRQPVPAGGFRFSVSSGNAEIAHAYLYVMRNDLHPEPFGLLEDVQVEEGVRGRGVGTMLVQEVIVAARRAGCYKLIATSRSSRPRVHDLYRAIGFTDHGIEFRIDLDA